MKVPKGRPSHSLLPDPQYYHRRDLFTYQILGPCVNSLSGMLGFPIRIRLSINYKRDSSLVSVEAPPPPCRGRKAGCVQKGYANHASTELLPYHAVIVLKLSIVILPHHAMNMEMWEMESQLYHEHMLGQQLHLEAMSMTVLRCLQLLRPGLTGGRRAEGRIFYHSWVILPDIHLLG